jgi:enoyl-CoA hydratase/carnithine racemase
VTEVVPHDELADAANRLAQSIAASPATAVQASLRAVWAGADLGGPAALSNAPAIYAAGFDPAALAEGAESFSSGARIKPRTR